jgi:succinoglycan biosynthesis transport protein ExoP
MSSSSVRSSAEPRTAAATFRDLEFVQLLKTARRRWKWMVAGLLMGIAAAAVYFYYAPRKYESNAAIFVMRKDPTLATSGVSGGEEGGVSEDLLATHIQLIQSTRIVSDALHRNTLADIPSIAEHVDAETTPEDYVIENLSVTRGGGGQSKNAHVLTLSFRHENAADAERVVSAIVDSYRTFLDSMFKDVNSEAAGLIQGAQDKLSAELQEAEKDYAAFRKEAPLLWKGDESSNVHRDRFEQVQADLGSISLQTTEARARLTAVNDALKLFDELNVPDIQRLSVIDDKNATRIGLLISVDRPETISAEFQAAQPERAESARSEFHSLVSLMAKEQSLLLTMGEQHPEVRSVRTEIALLKEFLEAKSKDLTPKADQLSRDPKAIVTAYVSFLTNDLAALTLREKELQRVAAESEKLAKDLVKYELEGETLRKEVERKQELYDAVVDRLREINLAGDYGGFINEVIVSPEVGELVWPKLPICLVLGTILGVALGAIGVLTAEMRDQSFRDPADIKAAFELPIISHVPYISGRQRSMHVNSKVASTVSVYHRPKSREAEVFRGMRTQLLFTLREANSRIVQFTSPKQGDGKTTVVANVAVSLARAGRRVLLIDADLRRPSIHKLFGVTAQVGLSSVILGKANTQDVIKTTEIPNLWVLPCGSIPSQPAELLELPNFGKVLQSLKTDYDVILVDSPPVLPVADPCVISSQVDGVVMIIRVGRDSKPEALRATEQLLDVGTRLVGIVVNGVNVRGSGYEYGVYGKAYKYYGNSPEKETSDAVDDNLAPSLVLQEPELTGGRRAAEERNVGRSNS